VPALFFIFTLLLALTGCAVDEATFITEIEFGKRLVADLQARNLTAIEAQLDRATMSDDSRANLAKMAELLPAGAPPTAIDVAGLRVRTVGWAGKGTTRRITLSLQYQFGDKWFLVDTRWRRPETAPPLVERLHVTVLGASLQEMNRFSLEGKSALHYGVLALAVVLPVFTLVVLVLCLRTPMRLRRKVLWIPAILLGVTPLSVNWTTGDMLWKPLNVQAGPVAFAKPSLGPATLSTSVPLGAIVFLFRRRSRKRALAGDGTDAASG
jgi:hypothetical protein